MGILTKGEGLVQVNEYRCYLLRSATIRYGAPSAFATAHEFHTAGDDQARLLADTIYRKGSSNEILGYEVWQASRLVHRHLDGEPKDKPD